MIIATYLLKNFFRSLIICGASSYSVFFIFSLIGNLGENFTFKTILLLSALNSLQIFTYIPSHLYILSTCLFVISLKSKNELIIIKEYLQLKKIFLIILPILSIFIFIESIKGNASDWIDKKNSSLINSKNTINTKIFIKIKNDTKTYKILKNNDDDANIINQYLEYQIEDQSLASAEFIDNLFIKEKDLFGSSSTIYKDNKFISNNLEKNLIKNFFNFWSNSSKVNKEDEIRTNSLKYIFIYQILFNSLFYLCISMFFLSKKLVSRDINFLKNFIIVLSIFLYFLIFPKIILDSFQFYFNLISIFIFSLIFLEIKKHE